MGNPNVIMRAEIDESTARTALDLVEIRRPQWLRTRGITSIRQAAGGDGIAIYLDNARLTEGVDALRSVPLGSVQYLQFFSAREATLRWGGGHLDGAILVSTMPRTR